MATKKAAKAPARKTVTKAPVKKQSKRTRTLRTIKLVTKRNPERCRQRSRTTCRPS